MAARLDFVQSVEAHDLTDDDVNRHIGRRIRRRRRLLGLTQSQLSRAVGLQFQQIQKYECAANKVCASRLFFLAAALETPVQYFFDGLPRGRNSCAAANDRDILDADDHLFSKEAHDLIEAYFKLPDAVRRKLREFAKSLGEVSS
jgi:transcriptional regulator with XRE-family HTH domain